MVNLLLFHVTPPLNGLLLPYVAEIMKAKDDRGIQRLLSETIDDLNVREKRDNSAF